MDQLPEPTAHLDYRDRFTEAEMARLAKGLVPRTMDEKWSVELVDNTIHCRRSWTGRIGFVVRLVPDGDAWMVAWATVDDLVAASGYGPEFLRWLLRQQVLGQDVPFPALEAPGPARGPSAWQAMRSWLRRRPPG